MMNMRPAAVWTSTANCIGRLNGNRYMAMPVKVSNTNSPATRMESFERHSSDRASTAEWRRSFTVVVLPSNEIPASRVLSA